MFGMDHGIDMLGDNDQEEELNEIIEGAKYGWAYVYANGKFNPHNVVPKESRFDERRLGEAVGKSDFALHAARRADADGFLHRFDVSGGIQKRCFRRVARFVESRSAVGLRSRQNSFRQIGKSDENRTFFDRIFGQRRCARRQGRTFRVGLPDWQQMKDGSMLVTDDTNNIIYRICLQQKAMPPIMSREDISMNLPETANAPKRRFK